MNNIEIIHKLLTKYQKHLGVKLKLICDMQIIFDEIDEEKSRLEFYVDNQSCVLISNKDVDLNTIKIAIEDYLITDNEYILKKGLVEELSFNELNILKEQYSNQYSMIIIQTNHRTEHLYSTISNIIACTSIVLNEMNQIVLLIPNEISEQELMEIKDTLETELYCKIYIAKSNLFNIEKLRNKYIETNRLLEMLIKYNTSSMIADENNVLLPIVVESIHDEQYEFIRNQLKVNVFKELDEELLMTIQVFLDCNLSISETARKMYIHRNTLIYRIEKIFNCTGYDIRNFDDAIKVKLAMICMKK